KMAAAVPAQLQGRPCVAARASHAPGWQGELEFSKGPPSAATKDPTAEAQDVRKNRSAGVSPAWRLDNSFCVNNTFAGWKPALHFLPRRRRKNGTAIILSSLARN